MMNRKVVAIVSLLLAFCFVFVACDVDLPSDVSWGFDDEYHWGKANGQEAKEPHEFDGGKVTKAPTATEDGITTYTCNICKYERKVAVHPVAKDWSTNAMEHWHTVTCGHDVVVDKGAHEFHNGVCKVCGYFSLVGMLTERFRGAFGGDIGLSVDGLYMRDINIGDYGPGKVNRSYFPSAEARLWLDDNSGLNVFVYLVAVKDSCLAVSGGTKDEFQLRKDGYIYAVNGKIYSEYLGDDASFTSDFDKAIYSTTFKICDEAGFSVYSFEHLLSAVNEAITPYRALLETLAKNLPNLLENIGLGGDGDGELPFITKKTVDGSTVYGIDYDVFEETNKELSTMTAQQFVDKLLGEGFVESLPGKLDELGKMTVGEVLDSIAKLGIDIDSLLEVARAVVATLPNVAEDTTLEDLIGQLIGVNKKFDLGELLHNDAVRKMSVANAITAAQDGNENKITYAEITKGILDQVELYKNKKVYELLAEFMHAAISNSRYIYEYINEFIQILRWFDIEAYVNDDILQKIVINGGIEPYGNDDVATSTEQARARESLGNLRYIADHIGGKITIGPADEVTTCDAKTKAAEMLAYRQKLPDAPESKAQAESLFEALMGRKPTKEDNLREVDGEWYYDDLYEYRDDLRDNDWNQVTINDMPVEVVKKGIRTYNLRNNSIAQSGNTEFRSEFISSSTGISAKCASQICISWAAESSGTAQITYMVNNKSVTADQLAWLKENYNVNDSEEIGGSRVGTVVYDLDDKVFVVRENIKHNLKLVGEEVDPDSCEYYTKTTYKCDQCGQTCVEYRKLPHDIEESVELIHPERGCEGGVRVTSTCSKCHKSSVEIVYGHHSVRKSVTLGNDEHYHNLEMLYCACGKSVYINIDYSGYIVEYLLNKGITINQLAEGYTYKCPDCSFEVQAKTTTLSTEIKEETAFSIELAIRYDNKVLFEGKYEEHIRGHLYGEEKIALLGDSCEDGWVLRRSCLLPGCDEHLDIETRYNHNMKEVYSDTVTCSVGNSHGFVETECSICGQNKNFYIENYCDSTESHEDNVYTITYNCGLVLTIESQRQGEGCVYSLTSKYTLYDGDKVLKTATVTEQREEHKPTSENMYELPRNSCNEGYYIVHSCSVCGESFKEKTSGHIGVGNETLVEKNGCNIVCRDTCLLCGKTYEIRRTVHTQNKDQKYIEAHGDNCETSGWTLSYVCAECGEMYEQEIGYYHWYEEKYRMVDDSVGCNGGWQLCVTCMVCGDGYEKEVVTGHNIGGTRVLNAGSKTCKDGTHIEGYCNICQKNIIDDTIYYDDCWIVGVEMFVDSADCSKGHYIQYMCQTCGTVESKGDVFYDHMGQMITVVEFGDTSCSMSVGTHGYCVRCNKIVYSEMQEIHDQSNIEEGYFSKDGEPFDCNRDWFFGRKCMTCGLTDVYYEGCGHLLDEAVSKIVFENGGSTCNDMYHYEGYCEICKDSNATSESKTGHAVRRGVKLNDGVTTCKDGVKICDFCRICDEIIDVEKETNDHYMMKIRLRLLEDDSENVLCLMSCLCGENSKWIIFGIDYENYEIWNGGRLYKLHNGTYAFSDGEGIRFYYDVETGSYKVIIDLDGERHDYAA